MDEAIAWHLRLPDARPDEWNAFVAWLEASPDHAAAYDRIAADDALLTDALRPAEWAPAPSPQVNASADRWWGRWRWGATAAGFAVAAALALPLWPDGSSNPVAPILLETAPGVRRSARLEDGSVVAMNGGTRLSIDRASPRLVTLEKGEAVFTVVHDAAKPFEVRSGGVRLQDVGTVFNVTSEGRGVSVQVAEGAVLFRPDRERLTLTAGDALSIADAAGRPRLTRVPAADVGGWRRNRLAFSATPLPMVAAALARNLGTEVTIDAALAKTLFTGSLSLAGGSESTVPRLARLVDTGWSRVGRRWTLTPRNHVTR
ncbi:FecR family protein [Sphingomonas gellani]|nr:FecR domain-containing protein [Sphingomonas gellani]